MATYSFASIFASNNSFKCEGFKYFASFLITLFWWLLRTQKFEIFDLPPCEYAVITFWYIASYPLSVLATS